MHIRQWSDMHQVNRSWKCSSRTFQKLVATLMLKEKHAPKNSDFYFKNQFHAFASSKLDCSSLSYKKIRATIDQAIIQKKCSSTHSGYERCRSDQFSSAQCVKLRRRTPSGLCKPVGLCFFSPHKAGFTPPRNNNNKKIFSARIKLFHFTFS